MNETIKNIIERRSIRKYKKEQITDDELNAILEAGAYAPSAGGRQLPIFVVLQDKDTILKLGRINRQIFLGYMSPTKGTVSTVDIGDVR